MRWVDGLALYYLAVEMVHKLFVILAGSPNIAEGISVWGLVFVHWASGLFVFICQPWRIITLGFGKHKLANALNRVEAIAGGLQGIIPLLGVTFATDSSLKSVSTGFLMTIIVGLLAVRVVFLVSERFSTKRSKWDFEREPEKTMGKLHMRFIELAKSGKVVGIYGLKASVNVKRRKVRARLEATREAMLRRIEHMKDSGRSDDAQINALYAIANEMAHAVNMISIQGVTEGPGVEERVKHTQDFLQQLLSDVDIKLEIEEKQNAEALRVVLRVHAYDRAMKMIEDHMLEYACAEQVEELAVLGQESAALLEEQNLLSMGFGVKELNMSILAIDAEHFTVHLEKATSLDEVGSAVAILNAVNSIAVRHLEWRDASVATFSHLETEESIGIEVKINRDVLYSAAMLLKDHESQLNQELARRAREWKLLFKNFGKVKFNQTLEEMVQVELTSPEGADADLTRRAEKFVDWCVESSQQLSRGEFNQRLPGITETAYISLKSLAQKSASSLVKIAQKIAASRRSKTKTSIFGFAR